MVRHLTLVCLFYLWTWDGMSTTIYHKQETTTTRGPQWTY
jgi:hypothetical protein